LLRTRTPAPIYQAYPSVYDDVPKYPTSKTKPKKAEPKKQPVEESIEIKPLEEPVIATPIEITPEPLPPEQAEQLLTPEQEQELRALEQAQMQEETQPGSPLPPETSQTPSTQPAPPIGQPPTNLANQVPPPATNLPVPPPITPPAPPPEQPPQLPPFEPLQSFAPLSPVVGALVIAANQNADKGNVGSATTTIERAIRIEPRNPILFYKLAVLRMKESKPRLAEDLAKKSALLAGKDKNLKKHSWLLIAKAREMQKNYKGAKEALAEANKF
jgi:hypothetical protein